MNRRRLLREALYAGSALAVARVCAIAECGGGRESLRVTPSPAYPIIDTHIHLFDPTRPSGVPWPEPGDAIYRPALPPRFATIAQPLGVVGAIAIEASPLASDNDWVLDTMGKHPMMVGMIGDLAPASPDFARSLDRLHRNPLFLGIRYGNLWGRNLAVDKNRPGFMDGLRQLAQSGLTFETANPDPALIAAVLAIADHIPALTIVIDHLPHVTEPTDQKARRSYHAHVAALGRSPKVFVKLSEVIRVGMGRSLHDTEVYKPTLDALWDVFGPDRVLFGSDWPNSDHVATYAETFSVVRNYVRSKGQEAEEKFFFRNSQGAYAWRARRADQESRA